MFGNNDDDSVRDLQEAADEFDAICLGWGGAIELGGKRIGVVYAHLDRADLRACAGGQVLRSIYSAGTRTSPATKSWGR